MKRGLLIVGIVCFVIAVALLTWWVALFVRDKEVNDDLDDLRNLPKIYVTDDLTSDTDSDTIEDSSSDVFDDTTSINTDEDTQETSTEPETTEPPKPVESEPLLDFDKYHEINPDIYAWIEIEGTPVDHPILQSPTNDSKYLTTDYKGKYYIGGSIFTESKYNSTDFDDPVTVIYGHTMRNKTLFGSLQSTYSDAESFKKHNMIKISLENEVRYYKVFAAVPYDNKHILYTYDFSNDYWYNNFFKGVKKIRSIGANFDDTVTVEPGDRVIILSTCLNGDSTKRYLVIAVFQDDIVDQTDIMSMENNNKIF
ncbi:MAG: class B sortase [Clostridiales bacterium]|nr:class B sortase [Clostridiales bacterium]